MSSLLLVLPFLLLFFSSQPCEARRLLVASNDTTNHFTDLIKELDFSNKSKENMREEVQPVQVVAVNPADEKVMVGSGNREGIFVSGKKTASERRPSGAEPMKPTSDNVRRQTNKLEGSRKLDQYSPGKFHVKDGAAESKELDVSDIVIMDYPQPRRKPPINNRAP